MDRKMYRERVDELTIVALAFLAFIGFNIVRDQGWLGGLFDFNSQPAARVESAADARSAEAASMQLSATPDMQLTYDPAAIAYPYEHFTLTQGPHGVDYGHFAIDLTAGKGATIQSPLNGVITGRTIDEYGNTVLVIENERYTITLMHGLYTVQIGEFVSLGQPIGQESNQGYTIGADGLTCAGRDCGYHTHMNIFDKQLGTNVNPLEVLPR
jgi:murein DD-endopeptidase MepM/ murein hydrolase activator NlpD